MIRKLKTVFITLLLIVCFICENAYILFAEPSVPEGATIRVKADLSSSDYDLGYDGTYTYFNDLGHTVRALPKKTVIDETNTIELIDDTYITARNSDEPVLAHGNCLVGIEKYVKITSADSSSIKKLIVNFSGDVTKVQRGAITVQSEYEHDYSYFGKGHLYLENIVVTETATNKLPRLLACDNGDIITLGSGASVIMINTGTLALYAIGGTNWSPDVGGIVEIEDGAVIDGTSSDNRCNATRPQDNAKIYINGGTVKNCLNVVCGQGGTNNAKVYLNASATFVDNKVDLYMKSNESINLQTNLTSGIKASVGNKDGNTPPTREGVEDIYGEKFGIANANTYTGCENITNSYYPLLYGKLTNDNKLVWDSALHTLTFSENYGATPTTFTKQAHYREKITTGSEVYSIVPPTRSGYSFDGYYDKSIFDGNEKKYYDASGNRANVTNVFEGNIFVGTTDVNLYAHWIGNTYNITYELNGGTFGSSHPDTATCGTAFVVDNPTKEGYEFLGWNITGMDANIHRIGDSNLSDTSINNVKSTLFNDLNNTASATVTFTAMWKNDAPYYVIPNTGVHFNK